MGSAALGYAWRKYERQSQESMVMQSSHLSATTLSILPRDLSPPSLASSRDPRTDLYPAVFW